MSETFCCMICRLLQVRSQACIECGAATMISLETGREALKYRNLEVAAPPSSPKTNAKTIVGALAGVVAYAGVITGSLFWWPAIPLIIGGGAGLAGFVALRNRAVSIADVELLPVATGSAAIENRGIARKLKETPKSIIDGSPVLVEQVIVRRRHRGVLLRRTIAAPFIVDIDGEKLVVAGVVRVTSPAKRHKLARTWKPGDPFEAMGIPREMAVSGDLETATIRDGDRVRVVGAMSIEMVPELAFHRDAGEVPVMRGAASGVVAIACEEAA